MIETEYETADLLTLAFGVDCLLTLKSRKRVNELISEFETEIAQEIKE